MNTEFDTCWPSVLEKRGQPSDAKLSGKGFAPFRRGVQTPTAAPCIGHQFPARRRESAGK